jgi:hypothetical protein
MLEPFVKVDVEHQCLVALDQHRLERNFLWLIEPEHEYRVSHRRYLWVGISGYQGNAGYTASKFDYANQFVGSVHDLSVALKFASAIRLPDAVYARNRY